MRWWRLSALEETACPFSTLPIQPYICLNSSHIPSVQSKYNNNVILSSCSSAPAGYPAVTVTFIPRSPRHATLTSQPLQRPACEINYEGLSITSDTRCLPRFNHPPECYI
jgi:hypothetical protein